MTNIGTFRAYVQRYVDNHPRINHNMITMVRQLQPGEHGLPIEIYVFTNTTQWVDYEGIQSDIFDHILAVVPEFGLKIYQSPTGDDIRKSNLMDGIILNHFKGYWCARDYIKEDAHG